MFRLASREHKGPRIAARGRVVRKEWGASNHSGIAARFSSYRFFPRGRVVCHRQIVRVQPAASVDDRPAMAATIANYRLS